MDIKDWSQHKDFDDLTHDMNTGDFKSILFEMRFSPEMAVDRTKGQTGTPPAAG